MSLELALERVRRERDEAQWRLATEHHVAKKNVESLLERARVFAAERDDAEALLLRVHQEVARDEAVSPVTVLEIEDLLRARNRLEGSVGEAELERWARRRRPRRFGSVFSKQQHLEARRRGQALVRLQVDERPARGVEGAVVEFVGFGDDAVVQWVRELTHLVSAWNARHQANGRRRRRV